MTGGSFACLVRWWPRRFARAGFPRPDIQDRLRQIGAEPTPREDRSPEFLEKLVGREISKWSVAIKAAGLAAQ